MNRLEKANQQQTKKTDRGSDRPAYHFTPPIGWLNDPNGFSYYKGKYHLFYQYNPFSDSWGLMFWGHAVSDDFVVWEDLPVALAPDAPYDSGGVFSGSAIEADRKQALIYTGSVKQRNNPEGKIILQQQCLAEGDGETYVKYAKNPIIGRDLLPEGFRPSEFRDPKVFRHGDTYYVVTVAMAEDGLGRALLYSSPDLKSWTFAGIVASNDGTYGDMWECPDLFSLAGTDVLLISPIETPDRVGAEHRFGPCVFLGDMDWDAGAFVERNVQRLDWGSDFYAPQTMETPDGRRMIIAWMQAWNNYIKPKPQKWHGIMTFPRELTMEGGSVIQRPAREIEAHRTDPVLRENVKIRGAQEIDGVRGRSMDLILTLKDARRGLTVRFASGSVEFVWKPEECTIYFTRKKPEDSVSHEDLFAKQRMRIEGSEVPLRLRFLLDTCAVEMFVNDGKQVFSATYYAPLDAQDIVFESGEAELDIEKYAVTA